MTHPDGEGGGDEGTEGAAETAGVRRRVPRERHAASGPTAGAARDGGRRAVRRRRKRRRQLLAVVATAVLLGIGGATFLWVPELADPPPLAPGRIRITSEHSTATVIWRRDPSSSYRVEYSKGLSFASAREEKATRNRLSLRALEPNTTYFLRVVAISPDGETSAPSRSVRFRTSFRWAAPTLTLKGGSSTSVTARWTSEAKNVSFETQLAPDPSFAGPTTIRGSKKVKVFRKLKPGTSYSVRTRATGRDGVAESPWSAVVTVVTSRKAPLRVASFNVRKSTQANWPARRLAVAETIRSEDVDVAGLQEATPITVAGGVRQYADIVRLLGPDWALTEDSTGPTGEARTVYNRTRLELVDQGYLPIAGSTRFGTMRYATWAIFEQRSTGKRFVFANTHFVYQKSRAAYAHRTSAARQMVDMLTRVNPSGLPVVFAGDFNSGGYRTSANGVYRTIRGAGYVDPLGGTNSLGSAEKRINTDLKTVNAYARRAPRNPNAPMVDNIFVTPMRVKEWETVARLDNAGRFIGTIPSDHNMIKATVFLP